jgi:IPT/TIG domain/FG-GAP-like repeat/FG-GAP repeat
MSSRNSFWTRWMGHPHRRTASRWNVDVALLEDRTVPTLLGNQLFPTDNPWNQKITAAPVAANSASIMNSIIASSGNGRLHPDFSQNFNTGVDLYGIPYNVVHGNSTAKTGVVIDAYSDESDLIAAPIPSNPTIEGDFQNGPHVGVDNRGDSHLLIFDVDNNVAYEYYRASRPSENTDGKWHADQETVWDMKTNTFRTLGWTSADAAGLSILAGLVRPDEGLPVSQGGQGVINHAIRFTLQNSVILNQFIYPASHTANSGNNNAAVQPPMGARFRLKAGVDITSLNPQARIIAQAMKDYGMIVADNGSNFFFSGASYAVDASNQRVLTWNDNDIQDSLHGLKSLHFGDFEVVDLAPQVTSLSASSGKAGSSVTINGQNFGGAAGHLQVVFGGTAAKSVTYVDDNHIVAIVPAGSGAVDVRVQSGVTTAANSSNYKSPIFGYGISSITTGDHFTYGTTGYPPPSVTTTSVTGADAGGGPDVRVFDAQTGTLLWEFYAYDASFRGGVRVASGDVNNDGVPDIITAPGPGISPNIRVWDGKTHALIQQFMAYAPSFVGGVYVAAGDTNGDGYADIITGADAGGGPHVEVFSGKDGGLLQGFYAYAASFAGGVRVAAGDVNGDGRADIITGAGAGGGPHVRVFDGTNSTNVLQSFMAYDVNFRGGVFVAAGDMNGDGKADIITGAGAGGGPHVKVFDGVNLTVMESFFAYAATYSGGVRVGVIRDVNGDGLPDIITTGGPGSSQLAKVFRGSAATFLDGFLAYDPSFIGGVFVGAA